MWNHRADVDNWMDDFASDFEENQEIEAVFFLDSVANVLETCSPDDLDAVAFGPRGCARKVSSEAYAGVIEGEEEAGFTTVLLY